MAGRYAQRPTEKPLSADTIGELVGVGQEIGGIVALLGREREEPDTRRRQRWVWQQ